MIHKMELKGIKNIKPVYLVAALVLGVFIVVLSNFGQKKEPEVKENEAREFLPDAANTEKRLEEIINSIDGVSEATVFITYENSGLKNVTTITEEKAEEKGQDKSKSYKTSVVTQKDGSGERPFVREETFPEVRGIIITAKGVGDKTLNALITDAVSSAMGVGPHRVKILPKD